MRKPAEHWETKRAVAYRVAPPDDPRLAGDARAERFELRFRDGRVGYASFGLELQLLDAVAATDPDVAFAAQAWLVARGQRTLRLHRAESPASACELTPTATRPFSVRALSQLPEVGPPRRVITLCPSNTGSWSA